MTAFTDFFWPVLDDWTPLETSERRLSNGQDRDTIHATSWNSAHTQVVLEEARRAFDDEEERRNSSDSKASTYLAVCVGLIPLMTYIVTTIIESAAQEQGSTALVEGEASIWRVVPSLLFLALSTAYLIQAVRWSFRAMSIREFHQVGPMDIVRTPAAGVDTPTYLAKEILIATRMNRDPINDKVTAIKMAHEFLKRASFSACATFFVLVIYEIVRRLGAT